MVVVKTCFHMFAVVRKDYAISPRRVSLGVELSNKLLFLFRALALGLFYVLFIGNNRRFIGWFFVLNSSDFRFADCNLGRRCVRCVMIANDSVLCKCRGILYFAIIANYLVELQASLVPLRFQETNRERKSIWRMANARKCLNRLAAAPQSSITINML